MKSSTEKNSEDPLFNGFGLPVNIERMRNRLRSEVGLDVLPKVHKRQESLGGIMSLMKHIHLYEISEKFRADSVF